MAALHETLTSLGVPLDASAGRSTGAPAPGKTPAAAGWGAGGGAGPRSGLASGDVSGDAPQALAAITARLQRSFAHLDSIGSKLQESSLRRGALPACMRACGGHVVCVWEGWMMRLKNAVPAHKCRPSLAFLLTALQPLAHPAPAAREAAAALLLTAAPALQRLCGSHLAWDHSR